MAFSAREIADWFLKEAEREAESLTQMKLQKLVYIAHGWHLALTGEPLIREKIEAWKWGPVVRSLYRQFAEYRSQGINTEDIIQPKFDEWTDAFLERIWETYKGFTAAQLSELTHRQGTPWHKYFTAIGDPATIPMDAIKSHYESLKSS